MTQYRIVCTDIQTTYSPSYHHHIVGVGTGTDPGKATQRWSVAEVINSIMAGNTFYTVSPSTGKVALVASYNCPRCNLRTLRSHADSVTDNNLDNLRGCQWSAS